MVTIQLALSDYLSGTFTFNWIPDIPGNYTVTATFEGSGAYYGSYGESSFFTTARTGIANTNRYNELHLSLSTYFISAIAGLFVLIIIVLALVALQITQETTIKKCQKQKLISFSLFLGLQKYMVNNWGLSRLWIIFSHCG